MGFIKSSRDGNTGIGKTFEDNLGIIENNKKDSDFDGFEVKSQRQLSGSKITLFTKSPSFPLKANNYLRLKYGKPDEKYPKIPVLHTSMYGDRFNNYLDTYCFKIDCNKRKKIVSIKVKDFKTQQLVNDEIYYTFEDVKDATNKLKNLFVVYADTRVIKKKEEFHFTKAEVFIGFNFDLFLEEIKKGNIQYDIRIGAYKTGV